MSVRDNIGSGGKKIIAGNLSITLDTKKSRYHVDLGFRPDFVLVIAKRGSTVRTTYWRKGLTYPKNGSLTDQKTNSAYGLEGGTNTIDDTGFYLGHPTTTSWDYEYVAGKGIPDDYEWKVM